MSCVIKSVSTYEETSAFQSYVVATCTTVWLRPPMQCIASTVERETEQTPMPSAHAQQAVAVLPGARPFRIWLFGSDLVSDAQ
jgi:hypothetical protein